MVSNAVLLATDMVEAKHRLAEFVECFAKNVAKAVGCLDAKFGLFR